MSSKSAIMAMALMAGVSLYQPYEKPQPFVPTKHDVLALQLANKKRKHKNKKRRKYVSGNTNNNVLFKVPIRKNRRSM